jgi:hypothetical protein
MINDGDVNDGWSTTDNGQTTTAIDGQMTTTNDDD